MSDDLILSELADGSDRQAQTVEAETPAAVVIDEAVELSKRFADPEAGPFINGLLDGMSKRVGAGSYPRARPIALLPPPART